MGSSCWSRGLPIRLPLELLGEVAGSQKVTSHLLGLLRLYPSGLSNRSLSPGLFLEQGATFVECALSVRHHSKCLRCMNKLNLDVCRDGNVPYYPLYVHRNTGGVGGSYYLLKVTWKKEGRVRVSIQSPCS